MKIEIKNYAQAFAEVLMRNPKKYDDYLGHLKKILKQNGDEAALKKILSAAMEFLIKKNGGKKILFESARPLDEASFKKLRAEFSSKDFIETSINLEVLSGVRVKIDGETLIDATLARKLRKLFPQEAN